MEPNNYASPNSLGSDTATKRWLIGFTRIVCYLHLPFLAIWMILGFLAISSVISDRPAYAVTGIIVYSLIGFLAYFSHYLYLKISGGINPVGKIRALKYNGGTAILIIGFCIFSLFDSGKSATMTMYFFMPMFFIPYLLNCAAILNLPAIDSERGPETDAELHSSKVH